MDEVVVGVGGVGEDAFDAAAREVRVLVGENDDADRGRRRGDRIMGGYVAVLPIVLGGSLLSFLEKGRDVWKLF